MQHTLPYFQQDKATYHNAILLGLLGVLALVALLTIFLLLDTSTWLLLGLGGAFVSEARTCIYLTDNRLDASH